MQKLALLALASLVVIATIGVNQAYATGGFHFPPMQNGAGNGVGNNICLHACSGVTSQQSQVNNIQQGTNTVG